jgi:hypothetical protein
MIETSPVRGTGAAARNAAAPQPGAVAPCAGPLLPRAYLRVPGSGHPLAARRAPGHGRHVNTGLARRADGKVYPAVPLTHEQRNRGGTV